MNLIFFDLPARREALKPFTFTRPIAELRVGILTLREKWERRLASDAEYSTSYFTEPYLRPKYPLRVSDKNLLINAAVCPTLAIAEQAAQLRRGQVIWFGSTLVAACLSAEQVAQYADQYSQTFSSFEKDMADTPDAISVEGGVVISHTWDIFERNAEQIEQDYTLITDQRTSQEITDPYTRLYQSDRIFVEAGATVRAAIINAESGPVYIGQNATVHENAVIKGPFAMLEGSHVNIGSKIREATTIGPNCKVGGEVKNTVLFANSNKGHEGFVGNSVVGEWCNFGADSNTSNLKNNYQSVRLWNYEQRAYESTGRQFCGLMMGDHSKCSINTMFNTGTVVGVFANIFGTGFPAKFIPSFTWGGIQTTDTYHLAKAVEVYERVLKRRGQSLPADEIAILEHIYQHRDTEFSV